MKKFVLVPVIIGVCLSSEPLTYAADLQAGWYAALSVDIDDYDGYGYPYVKANGWFTTDPGQYGPFLVDDGTVHARTYRRVSVPADVSAGPGDSLDLPVGFGLTVGEHIGWVSVGWTTEYHASQMYVELWRTRYNGQAERVWSQQLSGQQHGPTYILHNTTFEGSFWFRMNVVPEPSAIVGLGFGMLFLATMRMTRRRIR